MKLHVQAKNFLRVLIKGARHPSVKATDNLAKTAGHLKVVNMSVEDDRLSSAEGNARYAKSLE